MRCVPVAGDVCGKTPCGAPSYHEVGRGSKSRCCAQGRDDRRANVEALVENGSVVHRVAGEGAAIALHTRAHEHSSRRAQSQRAAVSLHSRTYKVYSRHDERVAVSLHSRTDKVYTQKVKESLAHCTLVHTKSTQKVKESLAHCTVVHTKSTHDTMARWKFGGVNCPSINNCKVHPLHQRSRTRTSAAHADFPECPDLT